MKKFKTIWIVVLVTLISLPGLAQDDPYGGPVISKKEQRKLAKEKKLADKKAEEAAMQQFVKQILDSRRFVLEADYVAGRRGDRRPVTSVLNFVLVDSTEGTIQVGSNWGVGYNGVGGVTLDGRISKYELLERANKRGTNYVLHYYLNTALGNYDVQMWISPSGNTDATIRGNYSGSVTFSGKLKPLNSSRVYKGSSI